MRAASRPIQTLMGKDIVSINEALTPMLSEKMLSLAAVGNFTYTKKEKDSSSFEGGKQLKRKLNADDYVARDLWWRREYPKAVLARSPPHLTKADLLGVEEFKFQRGKRRHMLVGKILALNDAKIRAKTKEGIALLAKGKRKEVPSLHTTPCPLFRSS